MWEIYDRKDKTPVGKPYGNAKRARQRRDVLDTAYGACRYCVRPLNKPETREADHAH